MTIGNFLKGVLVYPLLLLTLSYPIYRYSINQLYKWEILDIFTTAISVVLILVLIGIFTCYTICNSEESIKSWFNIKNIKFYIKQGKSNSHNRYN